MAKISFKFNLLPPKSKEIIAKEDKRSVTLLYSSALLFSIVIAWMILAVVNAWLKSAQINKWQKINNDKATEMTLYNQYAYENYELYQKANVLSSVVLKNTDPDLVFNLINNRIKQSAPNATITKYGRNSTGNYQISGQTKNIDDIAKLLKDFKEEQNVNDVSLLSMNKDGSTYQFIIDLAIQETSNQNS